MKSKTWTMVREYAPMSMTALAALLLSAEYWLQQAGYGGLCPTAGCDLVGAFVQYGEMTFVGLGIVFFWVLTGLLLLGRLLGKPWAWASATVLLLGGMAFDGGILGFQVFAIQETCVLCYAVGASLLAITAAYGWMRRSAATVAMGVAVWAAAFASQALLVFPEKTPDLRQTVLTTFRAVQPHGPELYYFFSLHCPFCTQVLASLAAHPPQSGTWHLAALDTEPGDQRRLSWLLDHPQVASNPFRVILDVEQAPVPDVPVQPRVLDAAQKGGVFLRNSGYRGVPLLIVHETPTRQVVLQGRDTILNYLLEKRLIPFRLYF